LAKAGHPISPSALRPVEELRSSRSGPKGSRPYRAYHQTLDGNYIQERVIDV
jgi:hypothetical protein